MPLASIGERYWVVPTSAATGDAAHAAPGRKGRKPSPGGVGESEPERNASSAIEKTRHTNRNPKNQGPMALTANVWTDGTTPLLTMKVPNTTSRKARITSEKFHALRRPRRSWTCDECR